MGNSEMTRYHSDKLDIDITVILRYHPRHAQAVEPLKQLVRDFEASRN